MTNPGSIVVFEAASRWVPELQRQLPPRGVTVRGRSRVAEAIELLRDRAARLLLVDLTDHEAAGLELLRRRWSDGFEAVACLVVAPRRDGVLEWTIRELGANEFFEEPVRADRLARLIETRYLGATTV